MKYVFSSILTGLFIFGLSIVLNAEFRVPRLTSPVMDQVGWLPSSMKNKLEIELRSLFQQTGTQLQVLIVPTLDGDTIEGASLRTVDKWQLGHAESDKGVLLMVAQKERQLRIEVGQGLEGDLTDAHSKRIISEVMVPLIRSGHPDSGILMGVLGIVERTNPDFNIKQRFAGKSFGSPRGISRKVKKKSLVHRIFSILFYIFMIIVLIRNPALLLLFLGGGGRGGGLGGGRGGGSWGGGGGGFSGGGASGGW